MQVFERDAYEMIARLVDPAGHATVLDVGANVGQSVRRIMHTFTKATVHAFEPAPEAFAELRPQFPGAGLRRRIAIERDDRDVIRRGEQRASMAAAAEGAVEIPADQIAQ